MPNQENKYTYEQLITKIVLANHALSLVPRKEHSRLCPADDDTGYPAECKCGADHLNKGLNTVAEHLKL